MRVRRTLRVRVREKGTGSETYTNTLITKGGELALPAFMPDATGGFVRACGMRDTYDAGVRAMVMNAYHLLNKPGAGLIKRMGGLRAFTGWPGVILTDSGGFQLYSLIRQSPKYGEIQSGGILFRTEEGRRVPFTPERCIQAQLQYGADICMALDVCTHPGDGPEAQARSVELTVKWARQCRRVFDRLTAGTEGPKPLLFGIIQGGADFALRKQCADALTEIGFDGFGFGGWPLDGEGNLMEDILGYTAQLMPDGLTKYAMGLGRPEGVVRCARMGYTLFDCVIPTREARHNRLYVFDEGWRGRLNGEFYSFYYALDDKHVRDGAPVSDQCDCELCSRHSRAYLRHLLKCGDSGALRLMTMHNLRFYAMLMEALQRENAE